MSNQINASSNNSSPSLITTVKTTLQNGNVTTDVFSTLSSLTTTKPITATTTTPTTTTITTTKSPKLLRKEYCDLFKYWEFPECVSLCLKSCVQTFLYNINEYFKCRDEMNGGRQPSERFVQEPLLMTYYVTEFSRKLTHRERYKNCPVRKFFVYDQWLWYVEVGKRLSDIVLPNYKRGTFKRSNWRWKGRNDTVIVPYGNIVRGEYHIQFAMYDNLITEGKYNEENFRLKESWSDENHPIVTGEYISRRGKNDWLSKPNYRINSIVMTIEMEPSRIFILPTFNTIAFTHLNKKLTNPHMCLLATGQFRVTRRRTKIRVLDKSPDENVQDK